MRLAGGGTVIGGAIVAKAPADVTALEIVEGLVEFVDTCNNKRQGKVHIRPVNVGQPACRSGGLARRRLRRAEADPRNARPD